VDVPGRSGDIFSLALAFPKSRIALAFALTMVTSIALISVVALTSTAAITLAMASPIAIAADIISAVVTFTAATAQKCVKPVDVRHDVVEGQFDTVGLNRLDTRLTELDVDAILKVKFVTQQLNLSLPLAPAAYLHHP